jgi:CheY-like chemotaxis protein
MALINDILDLSKIEAGRLELDETEFNLRELVDQTVELIAPKAQAKRLALRARVLPEVAAYLAGDPARLRQILVNLLGNAVKFTDSGQLGLTVKAVDSGIEFAVSDTGIGIPEHQLASIFQAFKQGDPSITRRYGGTGLGLGISRRLVEAMGGQLSVTSVVGVGSTFQFVIPLQPVKHNFEESPAEIQDLHGRRVALVDSDATSRMIMRETLAVWGLETQEFSTADDALTALAGSGPEGRGYSLAIIDRWMPAMDGFELAKKIRALLPALPVIMLASEDRPGDEIQRRMAGLTGYAIRPVGRTALLQLLSKAQRQSAPDRIAVDTPAKSQKPLRILVVEDSEDNQLLVQLYTENTPHLLSFAGHGEEALALLNAAEFDIVLMDLQMPVMDGLTATRRIRQIERERGRRAIPIIALSANARPQDIKASIEAGCNAHLSKPISKRRLLAALEQYAAPAQEDIDMLPSPRLAALVPKYLENRRKDLQRVVELHSKGDFAAIHGIVHNIKGTGTSYGFPGLTTLGAAMQASAESVDADALRVQIQELAALLTSLSASAAPPEPAAGSVK